MLEDSPRSDRFREHASPRRTGRHLGAGTPSSIIVLAAVVLALALLPAVAGAQIVRPWIPPDLDSLRIWGAEARAAFQANKGDSAAGANYHAYGLVGTIGRKLLRSLGREHLVEAPAIRAVLDSLGLDTDVRVDPKMPYFALLMVRNPYRKTAEAVGFVFWYRGQDLRLQGVTFYGGEAPEMRVWWTGQESTPYAWGIVERTHEGSRFHLTVLSLTPDGSYWRISEFDPNGLALGQGATVTWVDLNGDGRPELVAWMPASVDSTVEACNECPRPFNELTFVEGSRGFQLLDARLVPSPMTTFSMFTRLLAGGDQAGASRLLKKPSMLGEALSLGWSARGKKGTWQVLYSEPNTSWPSWLMVRHQGVLVHDWKVTFEPVNGRWLISGWENRDDASTPGYLRPDSLARTAKSKPSRAPAPVKRSR